MRKKYHTIRISSNEGLLKDKTNIMARKIWKWYCKNFIAVPWKATSELLDILSIGLPPKVKKIRKSPLEKVEVVAPPAIPESGIQGKRLL
jgi:hypothetical protein